MNEYHVQKLLLMQRNTFCIGHCKLRRLKVKFPRLALLVYVLQSEYSLYRF